MRGTSWPKFGDMNWLRLMEGPSNLAVLDIAPTMRYVTHKGAKYFRMPDARSPRREGEPPEHTEYGGVYLWDGWWEQKLAEARDARTERP